MIIDLGLIDYEEAYRVQKRLVAERRLGEVEDSLVLAEHKPIFTIGRTGRIENLLVGAELLLRRGIKVLRVDRGGDITFHGPGQLVAYPIVDLKARGQDLHRYLRDLEELIISTLAEYSVSGARIDGRTGVWVRGKKIASIGVGCTGWITFHGVSLNVACALEFFSMIHPCGIKGIEATSLEAVLNRKVMVSEVKQIAIGRFNKIFKPYEHAGLS